MYEYYMVIRNAEYKKTGKNFALSDIEVFTIEGMMKLAHKVGKIWNKNPKEGDFFRYPEEYGEPWYEEDILYILDTCNEEISVVGVNGDTFEKLI